MYRDELLKRRLILERQLAATKEELALIDRILEINAKPGMTTQQSTEETTDKEPYAGMSATQAITHFLGGRRFQFTSPREICRALLAGGIKTESRRFDNVVYNECDRMVVRGDLELGNKDGKKAYRLKTPGEE